MSERPVGIIGAGPAGLIVGAALEARGIPFEIVDAGRGPGGIWDIDRPDTPMYESAHFISSKTLSGLPDHPMPADYPDYPRHDLILEYVRSFARRHDLSHHATFSRRVVAAHRDAAGGWTVELDDGTARRWSALCIATGANWHPSMPNVDGRFDGEAHHSKEYRSPDEFRGRRVLIVGGGNSGCDIACDAALNAERAFISLRRGYHFIPKYVFGQPADVFAHRGPPLPAWIERPIFGAIIRHVLVGDLTRFGLPKPDHAILESHPILNTRILHHLGHGDLEVRPDVAELRGGRVAFTDGSEDEIDLIIWATGYRRVFPFLNEADLDRSEGAFDFYLNVAHRRYDDLFVLGLFETDGAAYPLLALQARLVAAALTCPPGTRRETWDHRRAHDHPDLRGHRHYLATRRHRYYVQGDSYQRHLERELKRMGG